MEQLEYQMIQDFLITQAAILAELDLDGFIAANSRADSLGSVLDPTLYRKAHRKLDMIRKIAFAATDYVHAYLELNRKGGHVNEI
jgi:hypothetical protein